MFSTAACGCSMQTTLRYHQQRRKEGSAGGAVAPGGALTTAGRRRHTAAGAAGLRADPDHRSRGSLATGGLVQQHGPSKQSGVSRRDMGDPEVLLGCTELMVAWAQL